MGQITNSTYFVRKHIKSILFLIEYIEINILRFIQCLNIAFKCKTYLNALIIFAHQTYGRKLPTFPLNINNYIASMSRDAPCPTAISTISGNQK